VQFGRAALPGEARNLEQTPALLLRDEPANDGRVLQDLTVERRAVHAEDIDECEPAIYRLPDVALVEVPATYDAFARLVSEENLPLPLPLPLLRDVQIAARHADPGTTMRYDRARTHLDRHPNYILPAHMASGT
jgi:hypothetical protein